MVVRLEMEVEMMVNYKLEPTTPDDLEDNSPVHRNGSSNSTRHTSGYATVVGIRECHRSSAGHQVGDLEETTSCRSGMAALFQNVFVSSFSPSIGFRENDA